MRPSAIGGIEASSLQLSALEIVFTSGSGVVAWHEEVGDACFSLVSLLLGVEGMFAVLSKSEEHRSF